MAKLVERLLATAAALWVRIQTSLKKLNERYKRRSGQHTLASQKNKKIRLQISSTVIMQHFIGHWKFTKKTTRDIPEFNSL